MKHLCALLVRMVLVLVTVAALALEVSCQTTEEGVKLCGRDFVRAVIHICGGPRWKRYLLEENAEGDSFDSALLDSLDDGPRSWPTEELEIDGPEPEALTGVSETHHPHFVSQREPTESNEDWEEERGTRLSSAFQFPLEEKYLRFKRGTGMAETCCRQGCTRRQLMTLC